MIKLRGWLLLGAALACYSPAGAAEPAKPSPLAELGPNRKDEPLAKNFSVERATRFLDNAALAWQNEKKCFTCHTNYAYLYARPAQHINDKAGRVTVARLEVLLLLVSPRVVAERRQRPATVSFL